MRKGYWLIIMLPGLQGVTTNFDPTNQTTAIQKRTAPRFVENFDKAETLHDRAIAIGVTQELIDQGFHRQAMFWCGTHQS